MGLYIKKKKILILAFEFFFGRIFDIEVQSKGDEIYKNRILYYWSRIYSSQLKESNKYFMLEPVICINVLNFTLTSCAS